MNRTFSQVNYIRVLSFVSFCEIDLRRFDEAEKTMDFARELNLKMIDEKEAQLQKDPNNKNVYDDYLYAKRTNWILHYHWALCKYMIQDFIGAEKVCFL